MPESVSKEKKLRILTVLRIFVAFIALGGVTAICLLKKEELADLFRKLPVPVFLLGVGLFILTNMVLSVRWYVLLRAQGIRVPFFSTVKVHFLGLFYNNLMVSSVGGDMLRVWYIAKHTDKRLEAGLSVVVDRVVGLFSLVLLAMIFFFLFPVEGLDERTGSMTEVGIFSKIGPYFIHIFLIAAFFAAFAVFLFYFGPSRRLIFKLFNKIISHRRRAQAAVNLYFRKPFALCGCVILTFLAQCLPIIAFWLMGRSMQIDAPVKYYFVFFPISWVLAAIPISIGGLGVLEVGVAGLFASLPGVSNIQGVALALCQRMIFICGSFPGILIHLMGAHLPSDNLGKPEEFLIDSDEKIE